METSAKASINVEDAFFTLARDIKAKMEKKLVRFLMCCTSGPFLAWSRQEWLLYLIFLCFARIGCHFPSWCAAGNWLCQKMTFAWNACTVVMGQFRRSIPYLKKTSYSSCSLKSVSIDPLVVCRLAKIFLHLLNSDFLLQEASHPSGKGGGHQIKADEPPRKPLTSWLSRCSILWFSSRLVNVLFPFFLNTKFFLPPLSSHLVFFLNPLYKLSNFLFGTQLYFFFSFFLKICFV